MRIKIVLLHSLAVLGCLLSVNSCEPPLQSSDEANPFIKKRSLKLDNGMELKYWVLLPESFDSTQVYPAVLTFPPSTQSLDQVEWAVNAYYVRQSIQRNWLVICPSAPQGIKYHEGAEAYIPLLLNKIEQNYHIEKNKYHLAGISNGGISAFRVGTLYPEYFQSLTVFPGVPTETDKQRLQNLQDILVTMYVGALDDADLIAQSEQTVQILDSLGVSVEYKKWENNGHVITSLTPVYLLDVFESYRLQANP
jgi:predicted peptidase